MQQQKQFEETKPDAAIDPVCGMTVPPEKAAGSFAYEGRAYYFCSTHCLNKFRAEPQTFLGQAQPDDVRPLGIQVEPTGARSSDTQPYTCPMHPEVREHKPGSCPKCGMALEPVAPQAAANAEAVRQGSDRSSRSQTPEQSARC